VVGSLLRCDLPARLHHSTWSPSCAVSDCTRAGDLARHFHPLPTGAPRGGGSTIPTAAPLNACRGVPVYRGPASARPCRARLRTGLLQYDAHSAISRRHFSNRSPRRYAALGLAEIWHISYLNMILGLSRRHIYSPRKGSQQRGIPRHSGSILRTSNCRSLRPSRSSTMMNRCATR
jgi:hypothetical protein